MEGSNTHSGTGRRAFEALMAAADETVRRSHFGFPFDSAPAYAWPGGYPIGYLVDDGEYLCASCVNDPSNPVHGGGEADGWRLEGLDVLEGSSEDYDGEVVCAHCYRVLVPLDVAPMAKPDLDDYSGFAR